MKHLKYSTRIAVYLLGLVFMGTSLAAMSSLQVLRSANMSIHKTVLEKFSKYFKYLDYDTLAKSIQHTASDSDLRITIIARDGTVLFDTHSNAANMQNHADRTEVAAAFSGLEYTEVRYSATLQTTMMYRAFPSGDRVIRLALPVNEISNVLRPFMISGISIFALILVLTVFALVAVYKMLSKPVEALMRASSEWSSGRLSYRIMTGSADDFSEAMNNLNCMAQKLEESGAQLESEKHELSAILESTSEGIIVIRSDSTISHANPAACRIFNQEPSKQFGTILEFSSSLDIDKLVKDCLMSNAFQEQEIALYGVIQIRLLARCSPLGADTGAVVLALSDISKIRHLEEIRKDFVANVSHELKTPITLIKGYTEAILDTKHSVSAPDSSLALDEKLAAKIEIIHRHADRMNAIIEDLLLLSGLESGTVRRFVFEVAEALALIRGALEAVEVNGREISIDCLDSLTLRCNGHLVEQALINLIDNALKYSEGRIKIRAFEHEAFVTFEVSDEGQGIPAESLPRLFERFYRVDRSRSRQTGGTGLGLAIVKHIAELHGGKASVKSEVGSGSTFSVCLPSATH